MAKPKGCPFCLRQTTLKPADGGFIEIGEYEGSSYEREGNVDAWECGECGEEFFAWPD